ncbi:acetate uptake transporter [Thermogemmatispora carboxidivorans]|uniref:acetate uptake transporter n=1 Tax=Thermogemmatispora carboxidivorans TaxID=1382306 RepID=UPI00069BFDBF|nr:acetate uptake transporter family protein [Thermogemmatispora carboxidivorans]
MAQIAAERSEPAAAAVANPAPLGLAAFALTTFVLSVVNAGLVSSNGINDVLGLALFYGGLAQFLAGMWEFRNRNTLGATAFSTYGAFWLAFGFSAWQKLLVTGPILGWFMLAWGLITLLFFLSALRTDLALMAVLFFLFLTFVVLGIAEFSGNSVITNVGGWLGIVTALLAWYRSWAGILESGQGLFRLPVGPMS